MSYTWQSIVAAAILILSTAAAYIKHKHSLLEEKVNRHAVSSQERLEQHTKGNLQSLPQALLTTPEASALLHEKCSIQIPNYEISDDSPEHFTHLLRHNMASFARYPQAWAFWLVLPKHRYTFSRSYIERLVFVEGDLVCGVYKVIKAKPTYVELSMEVPPRFGTIAGLLAIRLDNTPESEVVLTTETLQWTSNGTIEDLPLSKPLSKLLHEFASASLLISGAAFLESVRPSRTKAEGSKRSTETMD
jgi:hypothetical protein